MIIINGCAAKEILPGLCYKDKEGTFLCPEIEKEKKEPIYLEPIRNPVSYTHLTLPTKA